MLIDKFVGSVAIAIQIDIRYDKEYNGDKTAQKIGTEDVGCRRTD